MAKQTNGHVALVSGTAAHPAQEAVPDAPRYAWVILAVVFLASVAAPLSMFKVPPLLPVLMQTFNLGLGTAGMLMSIFAITGFVLAIPAGLILQRSGPKTTGLLALAALVLGAGAGALAGTENALLASRFVEGIGMGLITVAGPAAIALWFPAQRRGVPMGLWAMWVPVGSVVMYNIAPALSASWGWQAVWWASAAFSAAIFVLFGLLFRMPSPAEMSPAPGHPAGPADIGSGRSPGLFTAMANRSIWLLSVQFMCFNLAGLGFGTFYPTFLNTVRGYSLAAASFTASLVMLGNALSSPLGGLISDRIGSRKLVIIVPSMAMMALYLFPFNVSGLLIPVLCVLIGLASGAVPTATFAAVPEVMATPQLAGIGMAVLALGQNLGMFIGPWLFGHLIDTLSWTSAGYLLIPVLLVGIGAAWLVKVR